MLNLLLKSKQIMVVGAIVATGAVQIAENGAKIYRTVTGRNKTAEDLVKQEAADSTASPEVSLAEQSDALAGEILPNETTETVTDETKFEAGVSRFKVSLTRRKTRSQRNKYGD